MIYGLVISCLVILSITFDIGSYNYKRGNTLYLFTLIIFIALAGFRWKVGGDSFNYERAFENDIPTILHIGDYFEFNLKWEPLFVLFMSLCKTIYNEFWFFQLVHAGIVNTILFMFFKRYTSFKFTAVLIYSIGYFLYFNMEILRESIAVCVFTLMYPSFHKKQWVKYYLWAIVAFLFHSSALLLLLLPAFRNFKPNLKGFSIIIISSIGLTGFLTFFSSLLTSVGFSESITERLELYSSITLNINGVLYTFFVFVAIPFIIYRFDLKYGKTYVFQDLIFIYFLLATTFVLVNGLGRFLNYLSPFIVVYMATIVYNLSNSIKFRQLKYGLMLLILIVPLVYKLQYYSADTSHIVRGTSRFNLWYPYSSIFLKDEYPYREIIYYEGLNESLIRNLK